MRKKILSLLTVGLVAFLATGCVTQKQMTYLRNVDASTTDSINAAFHAQSEATLANGDAITIAISALDNEAVVPYNLPAITYAAQGSNQMQTTPMLQYYTVDEAGDIEMPVLGKVHAAGLKRTELADTIKAILEKQVVNPVVMVNLINAKVSVLGEVNHPSQVPMPQGRLTILDALAQAGDLTVYGRRDNVLVTRERDGKLEIARLNLCAADLYTSPFYYLQPNDVVYVSPNKVRAISSTNAGLWLSIVSTALSAATVIVTVVK